MSKASILAAAATTCVLYPYVIYPYVLSLQDEKKVEVASDVISDGSGFTIVFCAFNEQAALPQKAENLRRLHQRYPGLEFLAFDDGSTDESVSILAAEAPFVRVIVGLGRQGKAHGMRELAKLASGQFIIFTDANVDLDLDSIDWFARYFVDATVGGICGKLEYRTYDATSTAKTGGFYWRLEEKIKTLESRSGNVMGADGSVFAVRAVLYPNFPDDVLDDMTVSLSVIFAGYRLIKADEVVAFENLVSDRKDEWSRKVRIASRAGVTHKHLRPSLRRMSRADRFRYFSHKEMRWIGAGFLLLSIGSGSIALREVARGAVEAELAAAAAVWLAAKLWPESKISILVEIFLAIGATGWGFAAGLRGQSTTIWSPAPSRSSQ